MRGKRKEDRTSWCYFALDVASSKNVPPELKMYPSEAEEQLLDALSSGRIKAKFSNGSVEVAESSWFNGALIDYETRGKDVVARVRWASRDPLPAGSSVLAYPIVLEEDARCAFPSTPEYVDPTLVVNAVVPSINGTSTDCGLELMPPKRNSGQPSYAEHDAKVHLEMAKLLEEDTTLSVSRAAGLLVNQAIGAGSSESKARRLVKGYGKWAKRRREA